MQTKEIISNSKRFFQTLRKSEIKNIPKNEWAKELNVSSITLNKCLIQLLSEGVLQEKTQNKLTLNPKYESFAGIYIFENTMELSVIDFSGKQIYFDSKSYCDVISCVEALIEILKFKESYNIKAVTVCSNTYCVEANAASLNRYLLLNDETMSHFVPEGVEFYWEKVCVVNSLKWNDIQNINNNLNVIISFYKKDCYYTIMKNGRIIQKRRCSNIAKETEAFYKDTIFPILSFINPDNIIFVKPYKADFAFTKDNICDLEHKATLDRFILNRRFEICNSFEMKIVESNPSEAAAIHAMYKYYNWLKD